MRRELLPTAAELLQVADRIIKSRLPTPQAHFYCDGVPCHARWDYPGILSVFDRATGELLARSRRGHPTKPAVPRRGGHAGR